MSRPDVPPPPSAEDLPPTRSRAWLYLLAGVVLIAVAWGAAKILVPIVRTGHSSRLAAEANALVDDGNLPQAARKAQEALDLRLLNPDAWRAIARVFSRTSNGHAALSWWKKFAEVRPLSPPDRRDLAEAALATGDLELAAGEIQFLREKVKAPFDLLLTARLAAAQGDSIQALHFLGRVLQEPSAGPAEHLGAARGALAARRLDEPLLRLARTAVEEVALFGSRVDSLPARRLLVDFQLARRGEPKLGGGIALRVTPLALQALLKEHPDAGIAESLAAWDLQLQEAGESVAREVIFNEAFALARARGDLIALSLTAEWLLGRGDLGRAFALATAGAAARSPHLANIRLDALGRLGRWRDAIELLEGNTLPLEDWFGEMRLGHAHQMVGNVLASQQRWSRAILHANDDPRRLLEIARYAAAVGAGRASTDAANALLKINPAHRLAHDLLLAAAERERGSVAVLEHLRLVRAHWPDDVELEVRETYLALLCGESAAAVLERTGLLLRLRPENPDRRATRALALYRCGRFAEAQATLTERAFLREAENLALRVVRVAVLQANGFDLEADRLAQQIPRAALRPEEVKLLGE